MTGKQLDAVKALAGRYNSDPDHTLIVHGTDDRGPYGLPTQWVHVLVYDATKERALVEAGVSPEGRVHT
tara:strand:+ start:290 stop:496 length:207 start_codon:yes stop_codon:yes gene_type:complete